MLTEDGMLAARYITVFRLLSSVAGHLLMTEDRMLAARYISVSVV